jgi:hypothetical protein
MDKLLDLFHKDFMVDEEEMLKYRIDSVETQIAKAAVRQEEIAIMKIISIYADPPIDCDKLSLYEILDKMKEQDIAIGIILNDPNNKNFVMQNGKQIGPMFRTEFGRGENTLKATLIFDN